MERIGNGPFDQVGSAVLTELPSGFLCTCWLAEHEKQQSPSTTKQQLKYQCVINIIFVLNPNKALFQVVERKLTPSQPKTGHSIPPNFNTHSRETEGSTEILF